MKYKKNGMLLYLTFSIVELSVSFICTMRFVHAGHGRARHGHGHRFLPVTGDGRGRGHGTCLAGEGLPMLCPRVMCPLPSINPTGFVGAQISTSASRYRSAMDDSAGDAADQSQVHGWSSYPLSFPSQPPDIKNWFSSYEYDSPEVPELVADPAVGNGSETQDPFEHPLPKHSFRDGGLALKGDCLEDQSEPDVFAGKYLVPVNKGPTKPAPKRKQSLRALFGASFLDKDEEATETESESLLPVQRNALKPLSDCTTNLPETKQSQEGPAEHGKGLVDYDGISSVDTQESSHKDQEAECSKFSVGCDDARLANIDTGEGFAEDVSHQIELPLNFKGANLAGTEKNIQGGVQHSIRPVSHNNFSLADTKENSPLEEARHCKLALDSRKPEETVASDGFIAVKRKKRPEECKMNKIPRHPMGREMAKGKLQENNDIPEQKVLVQEQPRRPLGDRTNVSEVAAAPAQEVSRKWKCPRKGKPFVGRPMKQLRLEQWVRRMN